MALGRGEQGSEAINRLIGQGWCRGDDSCDVLGQGVGVDD
jgi:hypothetical protein